MMNKLLIASALVIAAACSADKNAPPAKTVTIVFSGPESSPAQSQVAVASFRVTPASVARNGQAKLTLDVEKPLPRPLSVDWYAPDGWLVSHQVIDARDGSHAAPAKALDEPGRYRVVLRSDGKDLAAAWLDVAA